VIPLSSSSEHPQVSSFTIIKGSLIEETYAAMRSWDLAETKRTNLDVFKESNPVGARSANWLRDVCWVLSRRFDCGGRDRALVLLAQAGCPLETWRPLLLWHMTRDEFLVRDFLINWLYPRYEEKLSQLRTEDVISYLQGLISQSLMAKPSWTEATMSRVASGLLRIASDFGLVSGGRTRLFSQFHLPDQSFLYLLHAIAEQEASTLRIIAAYDWQMYLMSARDVEAELLRLHQFRKLHYQVAGSVAELTLPADSPLEYAQEYMI